MRIIVPIVAVMMVWLYALAMRPTLDVYTPPPPGAAEILRKWSPVEPEHDPVCEAECFAMGNEPEP